MNNVRNELGNKAEKEVVDCFVSYGFWAFNIPKSVKGQPFDIIACKNNCNWFVDVKHLEKNKLSFNFDRIEPNQRTSMKYAKMFANISNLGFVIRAERDSFRHLFLSYDKLIELEGKGYKSVKISELENLEDLLCTQ